jgi:hypothetical protein
MEKKSILTLLFIFELCLLCKLSSGFTIPLNQVDRYSSINAKTIISRSSILESNLYSGRRASLSPLYAKKGRKSATDDKLESSSSAASSSPSNDDEVYRARLKAEIASPFYRIRQFAYTAMIFAGGLGTATSIVPMIKAVSNSGDVATVGTNLAIDVIACVAGIGLWIYDGNIQEKKVARFTEKEMRMSRQISNKEADERSSRLSALPVEIQTEVNVTRIVSLGDLQEKGRQNIVIVAGDRSAVREAVVSARLLETEAYTKKNTMVVPVVLQDDEQIDDEPSKGFGNKDRLLSTTYFGKPTQLNVWKYYLQQEVDLAIKQGEAAIMSKGLVLAVRNDGKVIRRGVGIPPWKILIEEFRIKEQVAEDKKVGF